MKIYYVMLKIVKENGLEEEVNIVIHILRRRAKS